MKKTISNLMFFASLILTVILVGCSSNSSDNMNSDASNEQAESNKVAVASGKTNYDELVVGVQTLRDTMDVNASVSNSGIQVYYNIADTLIMRDTNAEEVSFSPGLAESWQEIDDYTWEFKIREGVKFHNGDEMTVEDVEYSIERVMNQEDPSYSTANNYLYSNFEDVEVVDDRTIRIHTINKEPLMEFLLSDPNGGITSKDYVEEVGIDAAGLEPVYTGPYQVTSFDADKGVTLERFDDFWGEPAPFEKIEFRLIPEISSRLTALQNGEVDMITNIPPDQKQVFENNEDFIVHGEVLPMYHIYRFNMSNPNVDDPKLRRAIDLAIDR